MAVSSLVGDGTHYPLGSWARSTAPLVFPVLKTVPPVNGPGLESVIVPMEELLRRSSRPPDYAAESRALVALAKAMASSPHGILQQLADTALDVCHAQSAGFSLLDETGANFRWPAVAGQWACHVGGGTPRDFGPCGTVLDRNAALVFTRPERHFPYFGDVQPYLEEGLLVPFYIDGKAVGTMWVVMHDASYRFDAEDLRLITNLATFAAGAYQTWLSLDQSIRRKDEQAALYRFTNRLYRAETPGEVHDAALDAISEALGCKRSSILFCDEKRVMRFAAWRGLSDAYRHAVEGHSPWTQETKDPQPICIGDVDKADMDEGLKTIVKAEGIAALTFIPVMERGKLVGKFMTYYDFPHAFNAAEIDLALTIAQQLGFAVERMRAEAEQRHAQERQDLLARELQHRTKNLFAVVQSIVARSFAGKDSVKEAQTAVQERLHSLAQTHAIMADREWQGADLADVVRAEMSPYANRVIIEGPSLMLTAQAAQNFALAAHELATNAAKYGALSTQGGRVHIRWELAKADGDVKFVFRWQESGGPPVNRPKGKGFGTTVLEKVMAEHFDTPPRIEFAASGVCYKVTGLLESITEQA
jgi:two-component sensor histidine kinase